jgi:hypothetical protein
VGVLSLLLAGEFVLRREEISSNWPWRTSWRHIMPVVLAWSWSAATNPSRLSGHGFS